MRGIIAVCAALFMCAHTTAKADVVTLTRPWVCQNEELMKELMAAYATSYWHGARQFTELRLDRTVDGEPACWQPPHLRAIVSGETDVYFYERSPGKIVRLYGVPIMYFTETGQRLNAFAAIGWSPKERLGDIGA